MSKEKKPKSEDELLKRLDNNTYESIVYIGYFQPKSQNDLKNFVYKSLQLSSISFSLVSTNLSNSIGCSCLYCSSVSLPVKIALLSGKIPGAR